MSEAHHRTDPRAVELVALDAATDLPANGVRLSDARCTTSARDEQNNVRISLQGVKGPYYSCQLRLDFTSETDSAGLKLLAKVTSQAEHEPASLALSDDTFAMLTIIGKRECDVMMDWHDRPYVVMDVTSGPITIRRSDAANDVELSLDKIQTAFRHVNVRTGQSDRLERIQIIERPGLNNSTGQRLWDCALGMTCWLTRTGTPFLNEFIASGSPDESQSLKHVILELGAGCGLVSMAASALQRKEFDVLATDVKETVETSLLENITANRRSGRHLRALTLEWGALTPATKQDLVGSRTKQRPVTVLATDVLYNTSSHHVLLETLCDLLEGELSTAFIAYKKRTDGDDAFFALASGRKLGVQRVWTWGEISVWKFMRAAITGASSRRPRAHDDERQETSKRPNRPK
ncbi:hypothetical protein OIV83_006085 [Microbotryomycetes sp. JL201]|nr:hypothetical protein OIV83_006085 [Microbotryomycetes sp. JL201]